MICRDSSFMALFALSYIKRFWGDGCTCQPLAVWAYNRFWPILPKIWTWFYIQTTPELVGAWHPESPSGTYALTKLFRLTNKLMTRPIATISSMASLTTSAITVPKPLMMAQSSRKYSMNISIVLSFLSLKVSHFLRDSKGFRCLSADFNAISTSVHHNRLSPFPLPVNVLFPQCRNSDIQIISIT